MGFQIIGRDGTKYLVMIGDPDADIGRVYDADLDELSRPLVLHRLLDLGWELDTVAPPDVINSVREALALEPA